MSLIGLSFLLPALSEKPPQNGLLPKFYFLPAPSTFMATIGPISNSSDRRPALFFFSFAPLLPVPHNGALCLCEAAKDVPLNPVMTYGDAAWQAASNNASSHGQSSPQRSIFKYFMLWSETKNHLLLFRSMHMDGCKGTVCKRERKREREKERQRKRSAEEKHPT